MVARQSLTLLVWVQILVPQPLRRKLFIACDDFFMYEISCCTQQAAGHILHSPNISDEPAEEIGRFFTLRHFYIHEAIGQIKPKKDGTSI